MKQTILKSTLKLKRRNSFLGSLNDVEFHAHMHDMVRNDHKLEHTLDNLCRRIENSIVGFAAQSTEITAS